jgi:cullin-associated NEDD8-dissociated protein 1
LEVWSTYVVLLNQTSVYGTLPQSKGGDTPTRGTKRDSEGMDVEEVETPYALLRRQVPSLARALLKQLKAKCAPGTLQAGFALLRSLITAIPGPLTSHIEPLVETTAVILSQPPTTTTSTLHLTCLSFWALFYATHPPLSFASSVHKLAPLFLKSSKERHPRVASESFRVFSALLNAVKPVKAADWADMLYSEALQRLTTHDTDAEVREAAEDVVADLWICAAEVVRNKGGKEWEAICRTSGKTEGGVKAITKVGREANMSDAWINGCVGWLIMLLRKSGRQEKITIFGALDVLLRRSVSP